MPDIVIRPATLADVAGITAVHCSTVTTWRDPRTRQATHYAALDLFGRWYNGGPWMSVELCAVHLNHLLRCGHVPLVAEIGGTIVGEAEFYVNLEPVPYGPSLHLSVLYVHQDWQRQGVGKALLDAGVAYALTHDIFMLTTQPETEAIPFYQRAQFTPWLCLKEMQLDAAWAILSNLKPLRHNFGPPSDLVLRVGRYQCSAVDWDALWPVLVLSGWSDLRRYVWEAQVNGAPVILALREQLNDAQQVDGYAWAAPDVPLPPIVTALQVLAGQQGFLAVDVLLLASDEAELQAAFKMGFQTTVNLWRLVLEK